MILRACSKCGCVVSEPGQRLCARHRSIEDARRRSKRLAAGYHRAHWQAVRRARLKLAGYRCELRLPGCTAFATHVHLDPALRANHDAATIATTRACCASCSGAVDAPRSRPATTARADTIVGVRDSQAKPDAQTEAPETAPRTRAAPNLTEPRGSNGQHQSEDDPTAPRSRRTDRIPVSLKPGDVEC